MKPLHANPSCSSFHRSVPCATASERCTAFDLCDLGVLFLDKVRGFDGDYKTTLGHKLILEENTLLKYLMFFFAEFHGLTVGQGGSKTQFFCPFDLSVITFNISEYDYLKQMFIWNPEGVGSRAFVAGNLATSLFFFAIKVGPARIPFEVRDEWIGSVGSDNV